MKTLQTMSLSAALLAIGLGLSPAAWSQQPPAPATSGISPAQRETARALALDGRSLFAQKRYAAALERFGAAYQLVHAPTVGIEVARTQAALGKWVEANSTAVEVMNLPRAADEPPVFAAARDQARVLMRELTPRMPALRLEITPPEANAQVQIDGEELPRAALAMPIKLNPGEHRLRVSAPGFLVSEQHVALAERESRTLAVALAVDAQASAGTAEPLQRWPGDAASAPAAPGGATEDATEASGVGARTRGYVALGVSGAAVLVASVSGVMAFSSVPSCPANRCSDDKRDEVDSSRLYGNVATVSLVVAAVSGAYGLWELLFNAPGSAGTARLEPSTTPSPPARPQPELVALPGGALVGVRGAF